VSASFTSEEPRVPKRRQGSGRPRDPNLEQRAFEAARVIYGESGATQVTFANVASRAGIGKPALYRRWESPQDLLTEALRAVPLPVEIPDLGDAQAELAGYARGLMALYVSPDGAAMMRTTAEFHAGTETIRQWVAETSQGMIAHAQGVIDRMVQRGERRPVLPADTMMETITGTMLSHTMVRLHAGELPPEDEIDEYCWRLAGLVLGRDGSLPRVGRVNVSAPQAVPSGRRAELIRIAQQVVTDRGFADLTLASVAESAGVTTPALYTHFSGRIDLLEQVLESTAQEYVADLEQTDDPDAPAEERLRVRLRRWATVPSARLRVIHEAVLHIPESPVIKHAAQRASKAWDDFVRDVLKRGIERGEVRVDVDVDAAVHLLTSSLFGVEVTADVGLIDESPLAITDRLVDMFIAYVRTSG
jgi:AcrR family transcriptional regulator